MPYDDDRLLNGQTSADAKASPFVISIQSAGIAVLPSVMNVVIMLSVLSVGNSSVYGSSRTLAALAEQGQAPRMFAYIDRKGRPLVAIAVASAMGFLAFLAASDSQTDVFNWLVALSGLSSLFTWASICGSHLRFRHAWKAQGYSLEDLAFRSPTGIWGSWLGLIMNLLVFVTQFWVGFAPVGWESMSGSEIAINFFQAYLAAPLVLVCYLGHKLWSNSKIVRTKEMDLHTGKRDINIKSLLAEEKEDRLTWPRWKKIYKFLC